MGLFNNSEVVILKESSDSKEYLNKLQTLKTELGNNPVVAAKIDKEIAVVEAGIYGEDSILFELKNSGMDLVVLHDIYIETEDGRGAQIDFFVTTPYVNVIIECKNLFGNIEINNKGDFIRTFEYKGKKYKEGIYSPITQNERHLMVYKDCRKSDKNIASKLLFEKYFDRYNKSVVVLANPKTVVNDRFAKKEIKEQVIRCDQLTTYLKGLKSDIKSNKKEMLKIGENILSMNIDDRKDYIEKFNKLIEEAKSDALSVSSEPDELICPRCGNKLVLRTAQKGPN
ncbi:Nuclease-related domain-containing protein [Lachnospiraceae bacterium NE2001]|nr:Nuclease-related domain-containing protein [Lachnospiraceae bacterium NE2001]